jgi:hypothetical protein
MGTFVLLSCSLGISEVAMQLVSLTVILLVGNDLLRGQLTMLNSKQLGFVVVGEFVLN